jgi:hypothetical protein
MEGSSEVEAGTLVWGYEAMKFSLVRGSGFKVLENSTRELCL